MVGAARTPYPPPTCAPQTTELLKVFCTVYTTATSDAEESVRLRGNPADYIPFFVHFGRHLKALLRHVVADDPR